MGLTTVNSDGMKDDSIKNADIKSDAAITKSKLAALDIVNADVNASAAIATTKIAGLAASATTDTTNAANIGSGTIPAARIGDDSIAEVKLDISNTASDGQYLQYKDSSDKLTWATVTVPASYDDTNVRKDIAKLALQVAVDTNRAAYSLTNSFIDQFEDDTGIGTETNSDRDADGEYVASTVAATEPTGSFTNIVANNWDVGSLSALTVGDGTANHGTSPDEDGMAVTAGSHANALTFAANRPFEVTATNGNTTYGSFFSIFKASLLHAGGVTGSPDNSGNDWKIAQYRDNGGNRVTGAFTMLMGSNSNYGDVYMGPNSGTSGRVQFISDGGSGNEAHFAGAQFTVKRDADGIFYLYAGDTSGTLLINSNTTDSAGLKNNDEVALAFGGTGSHACNFTNLKYRLGTAPTTNATGTLESIASTADSSRTKVSGVLLYKDASGTAALGTDLKVSFSCDNGSNWTALDATSGNYTVGSPFSSGIKTAFLKEVTCTAGTAIKYKVEWANQASGSKETQLHGIGVNY